MRLRRGCSTGVPMPADALLACFVLLTWVRLEARPFHIPPRIALLGWSRRLFVDYGGQFRGDGRVLNVPLSDFDDIGARVVDASR
jgi:hypothetical protein